MAQDHQDRDPAGDPAAAAQHYAVLQSLEGLLAADAPTATIGNPEWFTSVDGVLVPTDERFAFHDQIISGLLPGEIKSTTSRPVAILLAGPPGSGKSTSLANVFQSNDTAVTGGLRLDDFVVIDADHIKGQLVEQARRDGSLESWIKPPEVHELEEMGERFSTMDFSSLVHEESSIVARRARNEAVEKKLNVVLDQVCSSLSKTTELVDTLSQAGYTVNVVEIHATREFSLESTFGRYVATAVRGGDARRVPTEVVASVFTSDGMSRPREAIESLLSSQPVKIEHYRRYDARALAQPPVLVEKGTRAPDGTMVRQQVQPLDGLKAPSQKKTKDEVLAAHRERARALVRSVGQGSPKGRRGPTV